MRYTGAEIILKQLINEVVPYIIGIPGHGILGLFDAIRKEEQAGNIKYIQVVREQSAAAIADGYFRMTGRPLPIFASAGPGSLGLSAGLANAYVDSTAFLALCGDTHIHTSGAGVLHEIERYQDSNTLRSLEPLSKRFWRAESVTQLPRIMRRAYNQMTAGRPGPCVVALPMDVQSDVAEVNLMPVAMQRPESVPCADKNHILRAVELMKTAKRPVILAGGGALSARADQKILRLAEIWSAGVVTTLAAKGAVSEVHPQYCFHTGSKGTLIGLNICRNADVILAVGTRFADETACSYRKGASFNFPDTKLIHIDIDASEIGKNYGADIGIIADLIDALNQILELNPNFEENMAYLNEITTLREQWRTHLKEVSDRNTEKLTMSKLISIMNETLPSDTVIATSSGNTQIRLFQEFCYHQPYCNLTTGGFSTAGWAVPAAIGARLAKPDSPVVAFVDDGDFMLTMQEMSIMARYEIPVIILLANNSGRLAVSDMQKGTFDTEAVFGSDFVKGRPPYSPDFTAIAKSFGIDTYDASTKRGVTSALNVAIKNNRPALIHVNVC